MKPISNDTCTHCQKPIGRYLTNCEECCEHHYDADEGFECLDCGKDGSEQVQAAAYDRAKDLRKYGDT